MPIAVVDNTAKLSRHLLCAVPQLMDPNFERSVVLMLEHGDEGAFGLVVNNPLPTSIRDVASSLGLRWTGDGDGIVRRGGPVEPIRGFVLHDRDGWDPLAEAVAEGLFLTTSLEAVTRTGAKDLDPDDIRLLFLLGYAGWGRGQLEAEMATGSWVTVPLRGVTSADDGPGVAPSWILEADPSEMWSEALRSTGIDPARVVALGGRLPSRTARS